MKTLTSLLLSTLTLTLPAFTTDVRAQTPVVTTLHNFTGGAADGAVPDAALVQGSDGNFYGTTYEGGSSGEGTVFQITSAGTLAILHSFTGSGTDGAYPRAALIQGSDGNFYGTTYGGFGTVFKMTPAGVLTTLHSFTDSGSQGGTEGENPHAGLVQGTDGNFYGTTRYCGSTFDGGTVFVMTPAGVLTTLRDFTGSMDTDGDNPNAGLIQASDGDFYGTTYGGGSTHLDGTVFRITSAGVFTILHSFTGAGTDGIHPEAGLIQGSNGNFYGTTPNGGSSSSEGTVFQMTPAGVLTTLHTFTGSSADGAYPEAGLVRGSDGNLYGTTYEGGGSNMGTVFRITTAGVFTILHSFTGSGTDGSHPLNHT